MALFDPWMPDLGQFQQVPQAMSGFLDNPQGRAALLSAGLALMQPPSFGDNPMSQIGRAIGSAGQSVGANEAADIRASEASSKQELRASQASAAETRADAAAARAGTAGARMDQAADRLAFGRERLAAMNERNLLGNRVRLSGMYQQYVKDVAKRNSDPLRTGAPEPVLPIGDWVKSNPLVNQMFPELNQTAATAGEDDTEVPAAAQTTTTAAPRGAPAVGEVRKGYRFKGGNPALPDSWEKV